MKMVIGDRLVSSLRYPRQAWILAGVIFLATLSTGSTVTPILPDIKQYFGLSGTATALIISTLSLARMSVDLPAGLLLDRFNHRLLLIGGILLVALGSMLSALAIVFPALLLGQAFVGVGVNTCMIAAMVTFSTLSTEGTRGSLFGLYTAATLGSSFVGPIVSGILASAVGWQATFVFACLAALGAGVLTVLGLKTLAEGGQQSAISSEDVEKEPSLPESGRQRAVWTRATPIYLIVFLVYLSSSGISHSAVPIYANESLHLTAGAIGWAFGLAMLFRSIISIVGGKLGDRYGNRLVVTSGLVTIGIGFLSLNRVAGFAGLLASMVLISLGHIGTVLLNAWLVDLSPRRRWGASLGLSRFWADLAHVIGPVAILYVFDQWGFSVATFVGTSLMWLGAIVAAAVVKRT